MSAGVHAYRNALRATRVAFRNDLPVLNAARHKIRQEFEANRNVAADVQQERINHMNDVLKFLIQNIVQGEPQDNGRVMLHFHDRTELGDNETIKQNHKDNLGSLATAKGAKFKKCSD